jgi:hypothetical protein
MIPHLMTATWRKLLGKLCEHIFTVPLGTHLWPMDHHEPLVIGFYLPLSSHKPWGLQCTPLWTGWRAPCQTCHLLLTIGEGIFCAIFSAKCGPWNPSLQAWRKCYCAMDNGEFPISKPQDEEGELMIQDAEEERHFQEARDGGNLVTPFQCDICHLINLMG